MTRAMKTSAIQISAMTQATAGIPAGRRPVIKVSVVGVVLCAAGLLGASSSSYAAGGADAQYQRDVARCNSGQTNQDKATCLKEAGAAQVERQRGGLVDPAQPQRNATARCDALSGNERQDCLIQMSGSATTTVQGSVQGGGVLRETVIPVAPGTPGSSSVPYPQTPVPLAPPPAVPPNGMTPGAAPYGTMQR